MSEAVNFVKCFKYSVSFAEESQKKIKEVHDELS